MNKMHQTIVLLINTIKTQNQIMKAIIKLKLSVIMFQTKLIVQKGQFVLNFLNRLMFTVFTFSIKLTIYAINNKKDY